jgi:hypothetical protein
MDGLQMQIMKTETCVFDLQTKVEQAVEKIDRFERLDAMISAGDTGQDGSLA